MLRRPGREQVRIAVVIRVDGLDRVHHPGNGRKLAAQRLVLAEIGFEGRIPHQFFHGRFAPGIRIQRIALDDQLHAGLPGVFERLASRLGIRKTGVIHGDAQFGGFPETGYANLARPHSVPGDDRNPARRRQLFGKRIRIGPAGRIRRRYGGGIRRSGPLPAAALRRRFVLAARENEDGRSRAQVKQFFHANQ